MRKFNHKKSGLIATEKLGTNLYYISSITGSIISHDVPCEIILYSNDWEEIVEPSYLITAFKFVDDGGMFTLQANGKYNDGKSGIFTLEQMLYGGISVKDESCFIYSVKNKDGIEFFVGDRVRYKEKENCKSFIIDNFFLREDDQILARNGVNSGATCEFINTIEKSTEKPKFVTEDGKEVFEGENYSLFSVYTKDSWMYKRCGTKDALDYVNWKHFHTKEAREEYVKLHKPLYSLAEIKKASIELRFGNFIGGLPDGARMIKLDDLKALNK
jgi:hypothetical protein